MFKVLKDGCTPVRGSKYSACVDLFSSEDVVIGAGKTKVIGLGVAIDLDNFRKEVFKSLDSAVSYFPIEKQDSIFNRYLSSHYLQVALRSSLGKDGLIMPNGVGIIDMDYRDEIKIIIHNPLAQPWTDIEGNITIGKYFKISKGDRIAQITLLEHKSYLFGIESDVIRDGGLGSTNTAS